MEAHSSHPLHHYALFLIPSTCVPVFMSWLSARCHDNSEASGSVCVMSHPISASILGPVFGNQDQFVGLAFFVDTFRNDLHGMDVSVRVLCHWPACFSAGPVFSDYARFHGLAVFIDTYSNDDATDVSGGSGLIRRHADLFLLNFHVELACRQKARPHWRPSNLFC